MVNFALGTLDVDAALAALPTLADLIHDAAPSDADVLGEYTWYEKALTGEETDTSEAVNASASAGWRKLFRVQMDSDDLDDVEDTDLKYQTNKECWVTESGTTYSSAGVVDGTRFNMMTDVTVSDPKSSNARAGFSDRGIGKDFLSSMANEVMGFEKSGRGSYTTTALATGDIFTNEATLSTDLEGATADGVTTNINGQIREAHQTTLTTAGTENTDRDAASNLAARVFDQLLSNDDGDRARLKTRLEARGSEDDYFSLLQAGDVIYFTLNIQPSTGSNTANVEESASSSSGPTTDVAAAVNADDATNETNSAVVAPIDVQDATANRDISNVKYMIKITLAQGTA
jgi:hypothetical protein